jgi:hypothetical protein
MLDGRDRQQALALNALRRAGGAPVSYAELREAGIELPASVVSELELAGVPIRRCVGEQGVAGVSLDPASEPPPRPAPEPAKRRTVTGKPSPRKRVVALAAVLAGIALVVSFVAIRAAQRGGGRAPTPVANQPHPGIAGATNNQRTHGTRRPARVPISPALATQLEAEGHDLLVAGRYTDAVPVLERAVLATGETVGACVEPASTTCLTYAYALYDLRRAERLSGEPQAAVPILERRLQINNQRSTVVAQLQLARQGIG